LNDWKTLISDQIARARDRLSTIDLTGARARSESARKALEAANAAAFSKGSRWTIVHASVGEASGEAKHSRGKLEHLERQEAELRAEIAHLELCLAIPERTAAAERNMLAAVARVDACSEELAAAEKTIRTLDEQLQINRAAMDASRKDAGARMLEAARSGQTVSTADTAHLIGQADAIEIAMKSAEAERDTKQAAQAAALKVAERAQHALLSLATEASEVALEAFAEQYVEQLAVHMANHWRSHKSFVGAPDVASRARARSQELLEAEPAGAFVGHGT